MTGREAGEEAASGQGGVAGLEEENQETRRCAGHAARLAVGAGGRPVGTSGVGVRGGGAVGGGIWPGSRGSCFFSLFSLLA